MYNKRISYDYFIKVDFFIKISTLSSNLFPNFKITSLLGVITVWCSWPLMIMEIQPCATAKCILDVSYHLMQLNTNTYHWILKAIVFLDRNCSFIVCHAIGITYLTLYKKCLCIFENLIFSERLSYFFSLVLAGGLSNFFLWIASSFLWILWEKRENWLGCFQYILLFRTTGLISTKLITKHPNGKGVQVY